MKAQCPHCNQHYEIDDAYNGQIVECARCNREFVPEPLQNPQQLPKLKPLKPEPAENRQPAKTPQWNQDKPPRRRSECCNSPSPGTLPIIIQVLAIISLTVAVLCFGGCILSTIEGETSLAPSFLVVFCSLLPGALLLFVVARVIQLLEKIEFNTRNRPGTKSNKPE